MEKIYTAERFADGFYFTEGPRWHENRLWFSDFYDHSIIAIDLAGNREKIYDVPTQPSGLGWLSDGRLVVSSMTDLSVMIQSDSGLSKLADISEYSSYWTNDLIVTPSDFIYVGNFGFNLDAFLEEKGQEGIVGNPGPPKTNLVLVTSEGTVRNVASEMSFPNGMVVTKDNRTLVVAESLGFRLTAFDINELDGSLSNRRVFADLSSFFCVPDGICIDADDNIWVANAISNEAVLVREGGEILARASAPMTCFATALGGADGDTLFMMCAPTSTAKIASVNRNGAIYKVKVK